MFKFLQWILLFDIRVLINKLDYYSCIENFCDYRGLAGIMKWVFIYQVDVDYRILWNRRVMVLFNCVCVLLGIIKIIQVYSFFFLFVVSFGFVVGKIQGFNLELVYFGWSGSCFVVFLILYKLVFFKVCFVFYEIVSQIMVKRREGSFVVGLCLGYVNYFVVF